MKAAHAQRSRVMHLLATTSGVIDGSAEAVDLGQDPADITCCRPPTANWPCSPARMTVLEARLSPAGQSAAAAAQSLGRSLHRENACHGETDRAAPPGRRQLLELRARTGRGIGAGQGQSHLQSCRAMRRPIRRSRPARRWRRGIASGCGSIWWRRRGQCAQLPGLLRASRCRAEAPDPATLLPKAGLHRDTSSADRPPGGDRVLPLRAGSAQTAPIDALVDALARARPRLQGHPRREPQGCRERLFHCRQR